MTIDLYFDANDIDHYINLTFFHLAVIVFFREKTDCIYKTTVPKSFKNSEKSALYKDLDLCLVTFPFSSQLSNYQVLK